MSNFSKSSSTSPSLPLSSSTSSTLSNSSSSSSNSNQLSIDFLTPYQSFNQLSHSTGLACKDPSLTQQQFAEEADINVIVNRFLKTGEMPEAKVAPQYADYEGVFDFKSAMNAVRAGQESFAEMPASIRARFHNSPQEFLEFCADGENHDEAVKLGLIVPSKVIASPSPSEGSTSLSNQAPASTLAGATAGGSKGV